AAQPMPFGGRLSVGGGTMSPARSGLGLAALLSVLAAPAGARDAAQATGGAGTAATEDFLTATRVDGQLTDAVWRTATPVTVFVQREPREGAPATFETEARVAFDVSAIHIAVRAFDPEPDKIVGFLTRRDARS